MNSNISPIYSLLRLVAFLGTGVIVLWQIVTMPRLEPRQSAGFIILVLAVLGVGLMLAVLSDATRRLLQYKDLLVPLGLFVTVTTSFSMLAAVPAFGVILATPWSVKLMTLGLSLSVFLVVFSLLSVVYVGWTTALILQVVVQGQIDLLAPFAVIGRWFWRTLIVELFGWAILLVASALVLTAGVVSMTLALVLLGITSLVWNLLTAAVLLVVIESTGPLLPAVKHGLTVSRDGMRKWAPLVIAQMLLLGWITFIHVSYTTYKTESTGLETRSTTSNKIKTDWGVNSFWTGGYADECKWYESVMKSLESTSLGLLTRLLTLLFAVLAIVVKIKIASDLYTPIPSDEVWPPGSLLYRNQPEVLDEVKEDPPAVLRVHS